MKRHWKIFIVVIGLLNLCLYLSNKRLWRDTYIQGGLDSLELPCGNAVPVGRWFSWPDGVQAFDEQYPPYEGVTSGKVRGKKSKVLKVVADEEVYMGLWSKDGNGVVELFLISPPDHKY